MTASALPVSGLIQISITLTPNAAQSQNLTTALVLGSSAVIDVVERIRIYTSLAAVAVDFPTNSPEYLAAVPWFGQNPQPKNIAIGRWALTATAAQLEGGALTAMQQLSATWQAITSGAFSIVVNGIPLALTGLNFSAVSNMNGVAAVMQTALNAQSSGCTVVWDSAYSDLVVSSGITGPTSTISFIAGPKAVGSATFTGQPTAADTITINGTAVTFVAGTPTGNQVQIGASQAATLASLLAFLNGSADTNLSKMTYFVVGAVLYIQAGVVGTAGNAYTLAKSSTAIALSGATLAGGTGTDISAMTGCTAASSGAYLAQGIAAQSALDTVVLFDNDFAGQFYGLCIPEATDSDHLAVAAYIEGSGVSHIYGVTTQEAGALSAVSTTDLAYLMAQQKFIHSCIQYSSTSAYAIMSYLAKASSVNYAANNSVINLMYKQEPGIVAESIGPAQAAALKAKNCNVFVNYNNNTAIIQYGVQCSGNWTDLITGTDWLKNQMQTSAFNLLYTAATKIPQTDAGMTDIANAAIDATCSQGVSNGFMAPGTWNNPGFGTLSQGDYLQKGWYVYQPSVDSQPQADRDVRVSVPFQVAIKCAGAVQDVVVNVTVNQ